MTTPPTTSDVVAHLTSIEHQLVAAWVAGDRSVHERVLAHDWTVIDVQGQVLTRAEVLSESFAAPDRQITSGRIDDIKVRLFGDWAVVTGRTHAAGSYRDEPFEVTLRFTDVFGLQDGMWKVVASQATLLKN